MQFFFSWTWIGRSRHKNEIVLYFVVPEFVWVIVLSTSKCVMFRVSLSRLGSVRCLDQLDRMSMSTDIHSHIRKVCLTSVLSPCNPFHACLSNIKTLPHLARPSEIIVICTMHHTYNIRIIIFLVLSSSDPSKWTWAQVTQNHLLFYIWWVLHGINLIFCMYLINLYIRTQGSLTTIWCFSLWESVNKPWTYCFTSQFRCYYLRYTHRTGYNNRPIKNNLD
jgi:hypothetical protein